MVVGSVYLHAPFCVRRCFYCDFAVEVRREGDAEAWAAAMGRELRLLEEDGVRLADSLETVYVGGGTPSLLGPGAMALLADVLGRDRLSHPELEWTSEANPESLTPDVAAGWRAAGVNRLSLGVQSFQEPVLRWMGRLHGAQGARDAVGAARGAGIGNLSVDLIFGLPESLDRDWRADLDAAAALDVPHISLYGLTAESGTPLGRSVAEGRVAMPPDERYREEYLEAHERLTGLGFRHYEVSNFARPGHESRHNLRYWDGSPYLGLGNGSHSFLPPIRRWNLRGWDAYLEGLEDGRIPVADSEVVRDAAAHLERLWLGLRTDRGVPDHWLAGPRAETLLSGWCSRGLACREDGALRLTAEGWLLLDRLTVELSEVTDPRLSGA
ncbi:MAG TPA: radical SAM family heme chaperone HemW [Longimicrobiales bacterium]|nr:radical SAM family heme chaperone HemW [Longimicrobiales bacterium]